jgi:hypothetical protein
MAGTQIRTRESTSMQTTRLRRRFHSFGVKGENALCNRAAVPESRRVLTTTTQCCAIERSGRYYQYRHLSLPLALELVEFSPWMYRTAVRSAHVCAVVGKLGRTVCQRHERPRSLINQIVVSRDSVRGSITSGVERLRVNASSVDRVCFGDVSLCCDRLREESGADDNVSRLFYALRSFSWTLYVAYCYGYCQREDVRLRLADIVLPSDQERSRRW